MESTGEKWQLESRHPEEGISDLPDDEGISDVPDEVCGMLPWQRSGPRVMVQVFS